MLITLIGIFYRKPLSVSYQKCETQPTMTFFQTRMILFYITRSSSILLNFSNRLNFTFTCSSVVGLTCSEVLCSGITSETLILPRVRTVKLYVNVFICLPFAHVVLNSIMLRRSNTNTSKDCEPMAKTQTTDLNFYYVRKIRNTKYMYTRCNGLFFGFCFFLSNIFVFVWSKNSSLICFVCMHLIE